MTSKLTRDIIQSEIADFFAGVVEIHTELGGPNTVEEAQNQLTERVLACVPAVDSEPVANVVAWSHPTEERTCDIRWRRHDVEPGPLYRHAQMVPSVMDFKKMARELVENLVDCDGADEAAVRQYLEWTESYCRYAMLTVAVK